MLLESLSSFHFDRGADKLQVMRFKFYHIEELHRHSTHELQLKKIISILANMIVILILQMRHRFFCTEIWFNSPSCWVLTEFLFQASWHFLFVLLNLLSSSIYMKIQDGLAGCLCNLDLKIWPLFLFPQRQYGMGGRKLHKVIKLQSIKKKKITT